MKNTILPLLFLLIAFTAKADWPMDEATALALYLKVNNLQLTDQLIKQHLTNTDQSKLRAYENNDFKREEIKTQVKSEIMSIINDFDFNKTFYLQFDAYIGQYNFDQKILTFSKKHDNYKDPQYIINLSGLNKLILDPVNEDSFEEYVSMSPQEAEEAVSLYGDIKYRPGRITWLFKVLDKPTTPFSPNNAMVHQKISILITQIKVYNEIKYIGDAVMQVNNQDGNANTKAGNTYPVGLRKLEAKDIKIYEGYRFQKDEDTVTTFYLANSFQESSTNYGMQILDEISRTLRSGDINGRAGGQVNDGRVKMEIVIEFVGKINEGNAQALDGGTFHYYDVSTGYKIYILDEMGNIGAPVKSVMSNLNRNHELNGSYLESIGKTKTSLMRDLVSLIGIDGEIVEVIKQKKDEVKSVKINLGEVNGVGLGKKVDFAVLDKDGSVIAIIRSKSNCDPLECKCNVETNGAALGAYLSSHDNVVIRSVRQ